MSALSCGVLPGVLSGVLLGVLLGGACNCWSNSICSLHNAWCKTVVRCAKSDKDSASIANAPRSLVHARWPADCTFLKSSACCVIKHWKRGTMDKWGLVRVRTKM